MKLHSIVYIYKDDDGCTVLFEQCGGSCTATALGRPQEDGYSREPNYRAEVPMTVSVDGAMAFLGEARKKWAESWSDWNQAR